MGHRLQVAMALSSQCCPPDKHAPPQVSLQQLYFGLVGLISVWDGSCTYSTTLIGGSRMNLCLQLVADCTGRHLGSHDSRFEDHATARAQALHENVAGLDSVDPPEKCISPAGLWKRYHRWFFIMRRAILSILKRITLIHHFFLSLLCSTSNRGPQFCQSALYKWVHGHWVLGIQCPQCDNILISTKEAMANTQRKRCQRRK